MSAGALPLLATCWPENATAEMRTANSRQVRDCFILPAPLEEIRTEFEARCFHRTLAVMAVENTRERQREEEYPLLGALRILGPLRFCLFEGRYLACLIHI